MKKSLFYLLLTVFLLIPFLPAKAAELSETLKGLILLQVEQHGEAWYVNPDNQERYYLGRPADAFTLMRELGLGVSEKDFNSFGDTAPARLAGKILLRVEASGEAYYVYPKTLKMHYLGRPADAFDVMRNLGLGITDQNLDQIDIKEGYEIKEEIPDQVQDETEEETTEEIEETATTTEETATSTEEIPDQVQDDAEEETATSTEYLAEYFAKEDYLKGEPALSRNEYFENGIDINWGEGGPDGLDKTDRFSVRWTGTEVFEEGRYKFTADFNDAAKIYVDNGKIMQSWQVNNFGRTLSAEKEMTAGEHVIKVEYYEHILDAHIKLSWEKIE